jgi:DNA sulfur modification protein DndD
MRFEELVLQNFGLYGGRQVITLSPPSSSKPIVLFGGLNGAGKTTLLDAILLALYGKNAKCSNRGSSSYSEFLAQTIHRNSAPDSTCEVALTFTRLLDGQPQTIKVRRTWHGPQQPIREHVEIFVNDSPDPFLSDGWEDFVEAIIPNQIANLFFFDGEQICALADESKAKTLLETAVNSLLGLDVVERLGQNLTVLERKKKLASSPDDSRQRIEALEYQLKEATIEHEVARDEVRPRLQTSLDRAEKELRDARQQFEREGGTLFDQLEFLEVKRREVLAQCTDLDNQLRDVAANAGPFLFVSDSLKQLVIHGKAEIDFDQHQQVIALLQDRDQVLLQRLTNTKIPASIFKNIKNVLADTLPEAATPPALQIGMSPALLLECELLLSQVIPETVEELRGLLDARDRTQSELEKVEHLIAKTPSSDALTLIRAHVESCERRVEQVRRELMEHDAKCAVLFRQVEDCGRKLDVEYAHSHDSKVESEHSNRVIDYSQQARSTLRQFRERIVAQHAHRLRNYILDSFLQLVRKADLVTELEIDPATFEIVLYGADKRKLPFDRLSAGERQLFATAILWGLAKASGRPLPTVIDTPLGRLDSNHRRHLIERYFPHAAHQVILLSTDEEIGDRYLEPLKKSIGRAYRIDYLPPEKRSVISPGYFYETAS